MRFLWLAILVLCGTSFAQMSGSLGQWEIYAGPTFLKEGISPPLDIPNVFTPSVIAYHISQENLWGGDLALTEYTKTWFGGTIDIAGFHRSPDIDLTPVGFPGQSASLHLTTASVLGGPQFRRSYGNFTGFARVMGGLAFRQESALNGFVSERDHTFAYSLGGGVDYKLNRWLAARVIQLDFIRSNFNSDWQDSWRGSVGLTFRFGGSQ